MTDRLRTLADDSLRAQKDVVAFWMAQSDLARKQVDFSWDLGRKSVEATLDLQEKFARAAVDALAPARETAKA